MTSAVVVGSGPNGLAAANVLSQAGIDVTVLEASDELGGGARSGPGLVPGLIHDHCAAVHPMAPASLFFRELQLDRMGVHWRHAEIDCAHPLDGGQSGALFTSLEDTAAGLGTDGDRWRLLFDSSSRSFAALSEDILGPVLRIPRHPLKLARFGAVALSPPAMIGRLFRTERARALFAGVAAHAFWRFDRPLVTGIGAGIITAGHAVGWPVIEGGTGAFTRAHVDLLAARGVSFETGRRVNTSADLPKYDMLFLDVHPHTAARILSEALPSRVRRAYLNFRPGPAAFKVDFAVRGGIPWLSDDARRAGTVHLGGTMREISDAELQTVRGEMPRRPFVLVGQQYLADPSRAAGDVVPVYAYAHVPNGYLADATDAIVSQIERFAPGFRDRVVASQAQSTTVLHDQNENFVGGDILTGARSPKQFVMGPRFTLNPYDTGIPGHYLCSAATAPGPGIHGMAGYHAAHRALRAARLSWQ